MDTSAEFDLRVESRFKNAILYRALKERFGKMANDSVIYRNAPLIGVACMAMGVARSALGCLLNLRISPYKRRSGKPTPAAEKIALYLERPVAELFPRTLYKLGLPDVVVREFQSEQILSLAAAKGESYIPGYLDGTTDKRAAIDAALQQLSERHEMVIKSRFGLDEEPQTLDEVAARLGVTRERVRQIEARALRTLRHPHISKPLHRSLEA